MILFLIKETFVVLILNAVTARMIRLHATENVLQWELAVQRQFIFADGYLASLLLLSNFLEGEFSFFIPNQSNHRTRFSW